MTTDKEIRQTLEAVIKRGAPDAKVFPWFSLEGSPKTWAGQLATLLQLDAANRAKVHAYLISRDESEGTFTSANCAKRFFDYQIFGFHFYLTGNREDNSDYDFNEELDLITSYLDNLTLVSDITDIDRILGTREKPIKWEIHVDPFGDRTLHFAEGHIAIKAT